MVTLSYATPIRELIDETGLPTDFITAPSGALSSLLDKLFFTDFALINAPNEKGVSIGLVVAGEAAVAIPGLDGFAFVVGSDGAGATQLDTSLLFTPKGFSARVDDVTVALRFPPNILKPVPEAPATAAPAYAQIEVSGAVAVDEHANVLLEGFSGLSLKPAMIGNTGIVISAEDVKLDLSRTDTLPEIAAAGFDESFMGVYIGEAKIQLPAGLPELAPEDLLLRRAAIGSGGVSGELQVTYAPTYDAATKTFSGRGSSTLFGIPFGLESVDLRIRQNAFQASNLTGKLILPFFDEPVDVTIGLSLNGGFTATLTAAGGLATLTKPGVLSIELDGIGFQLDEGTLTAGLSGKATPLVGGLNWPTFDVKELSVDSHGNVRLAGGWLDLPKQYGLNLFGFGLEITKLGFGRAEDGGRWVGFSGAIKLVDALPAGASVEGLRITWYDDRRPPALSFNGVGVEFEIPDVLRFKGEVAMRELPGGVRRFDGAIDLDLICISTSVSAQLVIGTAPGYTFFAIYVDAELAAGIPLFATGLGLYGFAGLFALNMEPDKRPEEQWYSIDQGNSWYHRGTPGATDLKAKWINRGGSVALGAGVTLGTLSDNGYAFSGRLLLAIVFPGPILLIEGAANLLKERAKLSTEEPTLRTLAVLDGRAGSFTFGVDARYRYGKDEELLDIRGSSEVYFSLADPGAWHLYIGRKTPAEQRIRAEIFQLFHANAYLELGGRRLATGAWIGLSESWTFGPASLTVEAWIEGGAELSFKPTHLAAYLWLHGKVEARAFGIGIGLSVDARLAAEVFTPFLIKGEFEVTIDIPVFPDIELRVPVQWGPIPIPPPVPLPLKEIAVEHFKATTSWPLPADGAEPLLLPRYDVPAAEGFLAVEDQALLDQRAATQALALPPAGAPVVPLDGRPHITFARPVNDPARVGTTAQAVIEPEWERIGDPSKDQATALVRYSLAGVELHRYDGVWKSVARTPAAGGERLWGSWAPLPALPDVGGAPPTQTKLWLWSRNPFDYTRRTGGALDDWIAERFAHYPCPLPLLDRWFAVDFQGLAPGIYSVSELQRHVFDRTFIDGAHRALVLDADPGGEVALIPGVGIALRRRGLTDRCVLGIKPDLQDTGEPCRGVIIAVRGGEQATGRVFVSFRERSTGPISSVGLYIELPFGFTANPLEIIAVDVPLYKVVGLNCGPSLAIDSFHPLGAVGMTVSSAVAGQVRIEAFNQDGSAADDRVFDDGPFAYREVVLRGASISRVVLRGPAGALVLSDVWGTAEYALHAMATGDKRYGPFVVAGNMIEVTGTNIDLIELHSVSPYAIESIAVICGPNEADVARRDETVAHLAGELARWSQPDFALEPYGDYRLAVSTRMEVKAQSGAARTFTTKQFAYFRTEGPPGLADLSLPGGAAAPEELTLRDAAGGLVGVRGTMAPRPVLKSVLNDLTPYVRQTLPATVTPAGEKPLLPRPVFRAYDVGVEFNENSYLEVMYRRRRRDLALYVVDASNRPARDPAGAAVVGADHWTVAEELQLTESERRWVESVDGSACVQLDRSTILRDVVVRSSAAERVLAPDALHEARLVPLLLHDDFSSGTGGWMVRDDGTEGGPSAWAGGSSGTPPAPFLTQTSSIRGGSATPLDPLKPGTVLLRADDPRLGAGHPDQSGAWGDVRVSVYLRVQAQGWTGVVVRDRGPGDTVRFALGPTHWTLVQLAAGTATLLASGQHALPVGGDHLVGVEAVGDSLRVHLDRAPLATVTTPAAGGRVGLYCWNAPDARFTDLRVDDFRPGAPVLYRFRFVTSRYASFEHQLHSFGDAAWRRAAKLGPLAAAVALPGRSGPSADEVRAFEALAFEPATVAELDVTRIDGPTVPAGFLLRSPEPLDWSRLDLEALRAPPWPRPSSPPGDLKLTGATIGAGNAETVTLLLRAASDLAGVVVEQLDWAPASVDGWRLVDEGNRGGPSAWTVGADLAQTSPISGPDELGTCALAGQPDWTDARLAVRLRSGLTGAIGAVLRHRDPGNCYRFSMSRSSRRLVCRAAGTTRVLWEEAVPYVPGQVYSLVLAAEGQTLTGELDGQRLFTVEDTTHEAGRVGLYCSANANAHFTGPALALPAWTVYHAFAAEPRPLPTGTRLRLYAGAAFRPHDTEPGVMRMFLGTGSRLSPGGATLRVRGGHSRRFLPAEAYAWVDLRILRNADGTGCLLAPPDGTVLDAGEYRLRWTYHRDNRAVDAASEVLSQAGATTPERPALDLPWRTVPVAGPAGFYPSGFSDRRQRASARRSGTEILILKRAEGPLELHIDSPTSALPPTDVWVLAPSGKQLWHGERIDLQLAAVPGGEFARLEHRVETTETGVFRVVFGAREFFLRRPLTDDLPEALLVKPGATYLWADSRGAFLNPHAEPVELWFSAGVGRARLVDAERLYHDLHNLGRSPLGVTVTGVRELELQAPDGASARFVASGELLFGSPDDLATLAGLVPRHFGFAAEVMADDPLAYYRFAEPAGARTVLDSSGLGNHGAILSSGVALGDPGAGAGSGARFRTADAPRVRVPDRDVLSPIRISVEALVAWSGPTGDIQQRIAEKSADPAGTIAAYGLSILSTGHVRVELKTTDGTVFVTSIATLVPSEPAHLIATYDGGAVVLYVNGLTDTVAAAADDLVPTVGVTDLGIGNQLEPGRERAFNGVIDELALYDHALPYERIQAHVAAVDAELGNLLRNPGFDRARPVDPDRLSGAGTGDPAAAEDWSVWNNAGATTWTDLVPTARPDGKGSMLHLHTTGRLCGLVQTWAPTDAGPAAALATAWVYVESGRVGLGSGNGGGTGMDVLSTTTGRWELLEAASGGSPVNQLILYSESKGGAEIYVDFVGVRALPAADVVSQAVPATAVPGERFEVTVTLRNRGPETWTPESGYRLGSLGDTALGLDPVGLPGPVALGTDVIFRFWVTAPRAPGNYALSWRMQAIDEWFGATTPTVTVQVSATP